MIPLRDFVPEWNSRPGATTGVNSRRGDSRRHDFLWWYHVNKCRAMRGNRGELAAARKSPRCHVNTPLLKTLIIYLSPFTMKVVLCTSISTVKTIRKPVVVKPRGVTRDDNVMRLFCQILVMRFSVWDVNRFFKQSFLILVGRRWTWRRLLGSLLLLFLEKEYGQQRGVVYTIFADHLIYRESTEVFLHSSFSRRQFWRLCSLCSKCFREV